MSKSQISKIQDILSRNDPIKNDYKLTFGRYRGSSLSDVPYKYLCWLEANIEPEDKPKLIKAVELEIEERKKR